MRFCGDRRGVRILGASLLLVLYTALVLFLMASAARLRDRFARLTVGGIAIYFAAHVFIHVAVNVGLLPMTGLTLPLISAGGSSLLTTFLALGLALGLGAWHERSLDSGFLPRLLMSGQRSGWRRAAQGCGLGSGRAVRPGAHGVPCLAAVGEPVIAGSSPCSSLVGEPLSAPTQAWLDARLAGLRGKTLIDVHAHLAGRGIGSDCEVHGHMESRLHPGPGCYQCYLSAGRGPGDPDGVFGAHLFALRRALPVDVRMHVLGFDYSGGPGTWPDRRRPLFRCPMGSCMRRWQAAAKASCPRLRSIRTIPRPSRGSSRPRPMARG
ncbi:MAG: FtsW/RodA/SpoVE family cell cycle protein [Planctomycetota bacterium]